MCLNISWKVLLASISQFLSVSIKMLEITKGKLKWDEEESVAAGDVLKWNWCWLLLGRELTKRKLHNNKARERTVDWRRKQTGLLLGRDAIMHSYHLWPRF